MKGRIFLWGLTALLIMALCAAGAGAAPGSYTTITSLNTAYTADVPGNGEDVQAYFRFVPTASGIYRFYSVSSHDTYGYLFDSNLTELTSNDDGGENLNFSIERSLTAGQEYYLGVRLLNRTEAGTLDVYVVKEALTMSPTTSTTLETQRPDETVRMAVQATVESGTLTFAWTDNEGNTVTNGVTSTATTSQLLVTMPAATVRKSYTCRVTSTTGETKVQTFRVYYRNSLTVENEYSTDMYVSATAPVTLRVRASCYQGSLHYLWAMGNGSSYIEGATGATYVADPIGDTETEYRCQVYDDYGNNSTVYFCLKPDNGFYIRQAGGKRTVTAGGKLTLRADAYCDAGELTHQWYYIDDEGEEVDIAGATAAVYTTPEITHAVTYGCTVTNDKGETRTVEYYISVNNALTLNQDRWTYAECDYDGSVTLTVDASCASGNLHYEWVARPENTGEEITDFPDAATITLTHVTYYTDVTVTVFDDYGNTIQANWDVFVNSDMTVERIAPAYVEVQAGGSATLIVEAFGGEHCVVSYRWYRDSHLLTGETSNVLNIDPVTESGYYEVDISDGLGGGDSCSFYVACEAPTALRLNTPVEITAPRTFSFTPTSTGQYNFSSSGDVDPVVEMYDENWRYVTSADDNGTKMNFSLTYQLTAGRTYYYIVRFYNHYDQSPTTVTLVSGTGPDNDDLPGYTENEYAVTLRVGQSVRFPAQDSDMTAYDFAMPTTNVMTRSGDVFTAARAGTVDVYVYNGEVRQPENGDGWWDVWHVTVVSGAKVITTPANLTTIQAEAFAGDTAARFIDLGAKARAVRASAFTDAGFVQINVNHVSTRLMGGSLVNCDAVVLCPEDSAAAGYCRQYNHRYLYNN